MPPSKCAPPPAAVAAPTRRRRRQPAAAASRPPLTPTPHPHPIASRYSKILNKIEANNYDNLTKRAYTTKAEKLAMIPGAWLKVQSYKNAKKEE